MDSIDLYLKLDDHDELVYIRHGKILVCVEVRGFDEDKEQDYMMHAGFSKSDTQWDKYGFHWNYYYVSYEELCERFNDVCLYTLKKNRFTKKETKKEITIEKAMEMFKKD